MSAEDSEPPGDAAERPPQQESRATNVRYTPFDSRYDVPLPDYDRYGLRRAIDSLLLYAGSGEYPWIKTTSLWDSYNTNILKGDRPISGEHLFLRIDAVSNTVAEMREIAGGGNEIDVKSTLFTSFDLFYGNTVFRPPSWRVKVTGAADIRHGDLATKDQTNGDGALQEAFVEFLLAEFDPHFDFVSVRVGRQAFISDFFGFIFNDVNDGVRFFGTAQSKRIQYDLAVFNMVQKDPFSNLNRLDLRRDQVVVAANFFLQDAPPGYTLQFTAQYLHDTLAQHVDVFYLGFLGDGVIGPFEVGHAIYVSFGNDDANPVSGVDTDISSQLVAFEIAWPRDWYTPRLSLLFASGDSDPTDSKGRGFDGIFDNPRFADAGLGFYHRQNLVRAGTRLANAFSLYPNLRAKAFAAPNSVNPGLLLLHLGVDVQVSNQLFLFANASYMRFVATESLEAVFGVPNLSKGLGVDVSLGAVYRPLGIDNLVVTGGVAALFPSGGFEQIFGDETVVAAFVGITILY